MRRFYILFCFFWISYAWFKTRSKRRAWPFLARSGILEKSQCISDEIIGCVPKNDFCKKSGANYEALVVQIRHGSNEIGRSLSFCRELDKNPLYATIWWIILKMWSNILQNCSGTILKHILGRCFTKNLPFWYSENEKWLFCAIKFTYFFGNIVSHAKTYMCAQYRHIITIYAMNVAITEIFALKFMKLRRR